MWLVSGLVNRTGVMGELLWFFWHNKWWWLAPMILLLLVCAVLIVFAQTSAIAPWVYTLF